MNWLSSKVGMGVFLAVGVILAMAGVLAFEGRLGQVRERLMGPEGGDPEAEAPVPKAEAAAAAAEFSSLQYFQMEAPFDADGLTALQNDLSAARATYERRTQEAERALEEVSSREGTLEAKWVEMQQLKAELEEKAEALRIQIGELKRDLEAYDLAKEGAFKVMANAFGEMDPAQAAASLMSYGDPVQAASVLSQMPKDVQGAIMATLTDKQRTELLPVWTLVERSRLSQKNR